MQFDVSAALAVVVLAVAAIMVLWSAIMTAEVARIAWRWIRGAL